MTKEDVKLLFISGDRSGVGKSTTCMMLLSSLLKENGGPFEPKQLGYIKPLTQCEDVQLVWKLCVHKGITFKGLGPLRFFPGFTQECVDGKHSVDELLSKVVKSVDELREQIAANIKELNFPHSDHGVQGLVIVDGIGYPSVGTVIGINNAVVAKTLNCPVLLVGKAEYSLGDAVDSFEMNCTFFEHYHPSSVIGVIYNKLPYDDMLTYGDEEDDQKLQYKKEKTSMLREYIPKYFAKNRPQKRVYGLFPHINPNDEAKIKKKCCESGVCAIPSKNPNSAQMKISQEEEELMNKLIQLFEHRVNLKLLINDIRNWN